MHPGIITHRMRRGTPAQFPWRTHTHTHTQHCKTKNNGQCFFVIFGVSATLVERGLPPVTGEDVAAFGPRGSSSVSHAKQGAKSEEFMCCCMLVCSCHSCL